MAASEHLLDTPAPTFALKNQDGNLVRLEDLLGHPLVLIFYPGDMTPGCTMQLCAIRDDWQKFQAAGIQVFGVNHGEALTHRAFTKKYTLPFPLLIDTGKKVSERYGAIRSLFGIKVIRRTVVGIDQQGIVRYLKHGMPRNADILKAMKRS